MSRNAVAAELQQVIEKLQQACEQAERLARSSGLVDPKWFRGAHAAATMALGELDQKGMVDKRPVPAPAEVGAP